MVLGKRSQSSKKAVLRRIPSFQDAIGKIGASTQYDFQGRNLTPYGGLLPLATMLEKLGFRELIETSITFERRTLSMDLYQFTLAILLGLYIGLERLNHLRYIARDPIVNGILNVARLPVQSTFWRFLRHMQIFNVGQWKKVNREMRERVWQASNIRLKEVVIDTDTTIETVYGDQQGARRDYNPKKKGKKCFQPILSFIAETREYVAGRLRSGEHLTGEEIKHHLSEVFHSIPRCVDRVTGRLDAGFYCWDTVEAHEEEGYGFIIAASKHAPIQALLTTAQWKPGPGCDGWTEFVYQPGSWPKSYRFIAVRHFDENRISDQQELFEESNYTYRVFVTNLSESVLQLVKFYDGRAGAENLIKEAKNDAGLGSVPSKAFVMNQNFFQLVLIAYNLNCWLGLFERTNEKEYQHTTLGIQRLRFLFIAAKIWTHANRGGIHYSDQYPERGLFERLMKRLRSVRARNGKFPPVVARAWV